jgi:hypothetical protein
MSIESYVYKVIAGCEIQVDVHQPPGNMIHPAIL